MRMRMISLNLGHEELDKMVQDDGVDGDLSLAGEGATDGCGSDLRDGNGEAIGLEVRELDMEEFLDKGMVEPLDKEGEEVELSSLPSLFLLRRELSLSTAATSYTDIF